MTRFSLVFAGALCIAPLAAHAEFELSGYGGFQTSPHSVVSITGDSVLPDMGFTAGWEGRSFSMPPYWGLRATWWSNNNLGWGLEFSHAKAYADDETLATTGFEHFEFSDGHNLLTLNLLRRWPDALGSFTPYAGLGAGIAIPHVELTDEGTHTFGYQVTGPAVTWVAGLSRPISAHWALFVEYKGSYSWSTAILTTGGDMQLNLVTNALNLGISYKF